MEIVYSEKAVKQLKKIAKSDRRLTMIETQVIHAEGKPIAVILDYQEYLTLKASSEDREDYESAIKVKKNNKKWMKHEDLKKDLGL